MSGEKRKIRIYIVGEEHPEDVHEEAMGAVGWLSKKVAEEISKEMGLDPSTKHLLEKKAQLIMSRVDEETVKKLKEASVGNWENILHEDAKEIGVILESVTEENTINIPNVLAERQGDKIYTTWKALDRLYLRLGPGNLWRLKRAFIIQELPYLLEVTLREMGKREVEIVPSDYMDKWSTYGAIRKENLQEIIKRRDEVMAHSIAKTVERNEDINHFVVFVGKSHLEGVKKNLEELFRNHPHIEAEITHYQNNADAISSYIKFLKEKAKRALKDWVKKYKAVK